MNNNHVLDPNTLLQAAKCSKIENKQTGLVVERNNDPSAKWEILYQYAAKHPELYILTFDKMDAVEKGKLQRYTKTDLIRKNVPELRNIANAIGASGESKNEMIESILVAQDALSGK